MKQFSDSLCSLYIRMQMRRTRTTLQYSRWPEQFSAMATPEQSDRELTADISCDVRNTFVMPYERHEYNPCAAVQNRLRRTSAPDPQIPDARSQATRSSTRRMSSRKLQRRPSALLGARAMPKRGVNDNKRDAGGL